jgi:hypothetical protein
VERERDRIRAEERERLAKKLEALADSAATSAEERHYNECAAAIREDKT